MSLLVLGDLEFGPAQLDRLATLVKSVEYCRSPDDPSIPARLAEARFAIACNFDLNPFLDALGSPGLSDRGLVVLAETGIVCLDPDKAEAARVRFTNLKGYSTNAVIQYTLRCILEARRPWDAIFGPYKPGPRDHKCGLGVDGSTVGLVGFGSVGRALADVLLPLGARVIVNTRTPFRHHQVRWTALDDLCQSADIVVVCCDLNHTSRGLIGEPLLRGLRQAAMLISISPNQVFDQPALHAVLTERSDVSAWFDFDAGADYERLDALPNCHLSPHLAFFTDQTLQTRSEQCIDHVEDFLRGRGVFHAGGAKPRSQHDGVREHGPEDAVLRVASRFYQSEALFAALDTRLFDAFGDGVETAATVADKTGLDRGVLDGLLPALCSSGLLVREGEREFYLPKQFADVLHSSSDRYYGATALALREYVRPAWERLPEALQQGAPVYLIQDRRARVPQASRECTSGSDAQARSIASQVTGHLLRSGGSNIQRMADLGCGSALITRCLLQELPHARADLVDTAAVIDVTREYLERDGLLDRCRLLTADYHSGESLDGPLDLVLLSNIIHIESTARCESLIRRSVAAMSPVGSVAVISFMLGPESVSDFLIPHFSLSCRLLTRHGHCHRTSDVVSWMRAAGCRDVVSYPLTTYLDLIVGRDPQ